MEKTQKEPGKMTLEDFIIKWLPVFIAAVLSYFTAQVPLLIQRQKDKAAKELTEKDAAAKETETLGKYLEYARGAATDAISKSQIIVDLENQNRENRIKIEQLEAENRLKEREANIRDQEIANLREDNSKLKARVKLLEDTLREKNMPVPNGNGE
jgi:hypothetical protein